jgi:TolB-like protein
VPKLADIGLVADVDEARSFVGTVGFIPPEGPGTAQADVYSLGKVLYEMLTGKDRQEFPALPEEFQKSAETALRELNHVILKACESDAQRRYPSAEAMHNDLARIAGGKSAIRWHALEQRTSTLAKLGFVAVVVGLVVCAGWLAFKTFNRRDTIGPQTGHTHPSGLIATKTIVVLPFDNASPDQADEYLGTQMAEELSSALTKVPNFRVLGRHSAIALKNTNAAVDLVRQLKLEVILEGRIRKVGNKLYVSAHLLDARDGHQLWSEIYDREMQDIFGIQDHVGQPEQALGWLEKACEERDNNVLDLKVRPLFRSLWQEPRFKAVLKKVGLEK